MPARTSIEPLVQATGFRYRYHPRGASKELFESREPEILIAGPKGTGKSLGALHKCHLMLSKYPGARGFMARKTRTSMTNSCLETFQREVLKPPDKVHFHKQDQQFNYPNSSLLAVIGMDNIDRLNSSNWDFGFIQEATECEVKDWEIASACIRFGIMPYKQLMGDCNPSAPTHWLKKKVDSKDIKMLLSTHQDNPRLFDASTNDWTTEGLAYLHRLQKMTGVRHARLYLGQWAAAEGMVYDGWDPLKHQISVANLPSGWEDWPHYWAVDFGYRDPFVWGDWIEDPKGRLYLLRQIYRTGTLVEDMAEEIMDLNQGFKEPRAIICDHDAEGRATFERHTGLLTLPAYKAIADGVQAVQKRLETADDDQPRIFFVRDNLVGVDQNLEMDGKPYSLEMEFDGYTWPDKDKKKLNRAKDEVPVDLNNHGMDMMRYMVAFADSIATDPEEIEELLIYEDSVRISPY